MPAFPGVDFIEFDSLLNDEEKLVRQTARRFVDEQVIPIIEKHNREGSFPMHLVPQVAELGFFGEASDRKSTRLNSSHVAISYAVFCLKKKRRRRQDTT